MANLTVETPVPRITVDPPEENDNPEETSALAEPVDPPTYEAVVNEAPLVASSSSSERVKPKSKASEADDDPDLQTVATVLRGDLESATISYTPCYLEEHEAKERFDECMEQIPFSTMAWRAGRVLPRLVYRYDPNAMSKAVKLMARNVPLPDELEDARQIRVLDALIRRLEMDTGRKITGVFCNQYRDGKDYTPSYQDSYGCDVFTLSLGATRKCVFDPIAGQPLAVDPIAGVSETDLIHEPERQTFDLNSGDLLYFNMAANNVYKHSIPSCSKAGPRISLVFFAQ